MSSGNLRDEMLEAFLAIEPHDAHVQDRRRVQREAVAPVVAASVAQHRKINGATGIPESPAVPLAVKPEARRIKDPSLTDALYYAARERSPTDANIGRVWVDENPMTRLGALSFIRPPKRQPHHETAAERFKSSYEALFGSGVPALDNSRPVVDRSPVAHDSGMAAKIDRGHDMIALIGGRPGVSPILSPASVDRLVACLVLCIPCGEGLHWRAREKNIDMLLDDLDRLSVHWHLKSRAA